MKQDEDLELIKDFTANDNDKAFEKLVEKYTKTGLSFIYGILGDMTLAEDIVQDTFIKFYETASDFKTEGGNFKAWFFKVLYNRSIDFLRKNNRYNEDTDILLIDDKTDAVHHIETKEIKKEIKKAMETLPIRQKQALILNYYEEYSQIKASEVMNVSLKAYESLLSRAKQNLALKLKGVL